ncbi:glycosyltransferase family 2 protein [Clostridium sp. A1-XYC3]|uniref:Glycosyltransferase family 2 protein n=1 Tax=Clostridium tanneri TaxID=3037988 RepID=A0ABU4JNX5_9CLOT|nr:glycosyltransferase family 2 protein [Clostridium sp. A1-XYC3]MDW8799694.1 glycosyltransferase family 2 protein [Clostridium sp. A1-XYC3]
MLLSIAMIVKNEEKNIEKCLQALKPLKNNVNYEIIIVDTGSTDNTISIAKKYTEKIYEHQWTNNFAEMRNLSISYCKGNWILVIDADEVLENPDELISFFKEKYKSYNSAVVKLNNYTSGDMYVIGGLIRLFKNEGDFHYAGRVHEQPICKKPTCITNITFNHYGYCRNDYDLMQYKYDRNIKLLLKDLDEGKDEIYTLFQLCQSYSMANKKNQALKSINKAYKLVKSKKELKNDVRYLYVDRQLAIELFDSSNYERTIEVCEKAILIGDNFIDFYYLLSKSNNFLKNYSAAEKYFGKYFELYENNKKEYIDYVTVVDFSTSRHSEMLMNRIINLYELKNYKKIIQLCEKLNRKEREELNQIILYSFIKEKEYKKISDFYKNKEIKDKDIENISVVIQRVVLESSNSNFNNLFNSFKDLNKIMSCYLKYIIFDNKIDIKNAEVNYENFYSWKAEILKSKIKEDISVLEEIKKLDNIDKEKYLDYVCSDYECIKILNNYEKDNFLCPDIKSLSFINMIEMKLTFLSYIQEKKLEDLIQRTFTNNINLIQQIYNFDTINEENSKFILNRYQYFWYKINCVISKYCNDKLHYIKGLKAITKEMPEFKKVLEVFTESISDTVISSEMEKEKDNILAKVEELVNNNMLDEAENILRELDGVFLYDTRVKNSLGVVLFLKGQLDNSLINLAISNILKQNNFDTIYNLACVLESKQNFDAAIYYYSKAYELCQDEEFKIQIKNIINTLSKG